jgi:hypothetical protein
LKIKKNKFLCLNWIYCNSNCYKARWGWIALKLFQWTSSPQTQKAILWIVILNTAQSQDRPSISLRIRQHLQPWELINCLKQNTSAETKSKSVIKKFPTVHGTVPFINMFTSLQLVSCPEQNKSSPYPRTLLHMIQFNIIIWSTTPHVSKQQLHFMVLFIVIALKIVKLTFWTVISWRIRTSACCTSLPNYLKIQLNKVGIV